MFALNKLNGWQRLWIALSIVYGIGVTLVTAINFPTKEDVVRQWAAVVLDDWDSFMLEGKDAVRSRHRQSFKDLNDWVVVRGVIDVNNLPLEVVENSAFEAIDETKKMELTDNADSDAKAFVNRMVSYKNLYTEEVAGLRKKQFNTIYLGTSAWLIPSIIILALGYTIAWIIDGFRSKQ